MSTFFRILAVFLVISILFQFLLDWDELVRAGWPVQQLLRKFGIAIGVAFVAAGAFVTFQRQEEDDD